ncbi:MAG TPA: hypothetical protein HPQ03_07250 [Deltaproteobacteria bacterium]|nr:hypothetical protein [Deltaproteobacteria bacterium]
MARKIIGLDIKEDAIAAVTVKTGFRGNSIEAYVQVPIPESEDGLVLGLEQITEVLDVRGAVCIVSIPARDVSIRNLTLPFKHSKKIRQILPYELEQNLPISAEHLTTDFHRIPSRESDNETDIIAGAVDQSRLGAYQESLSPFGVQPDRITVGGYPAAVWLSGRSFFEEKGMILDIGKRTCTLFIIVSGEIHFIRTFSVIATPSLKISSICSDIFRTVVAFEEMFNTEFSPERMLITGDRSDDIRLAEEMSNQMEIPVQPVDMSQEAGIQIKRELKETWNPLLMNNALSLALTEIEGINGFNFQRKSFSDRKLWNEHGKRIVVCGTLACLVGLLGLFNLFYETYTLQKRVAVLDRKMIQIFKETFPDVKRIVDPLHQMRIKIKEAKKDALYSGYGESSVRVIDLLNDISLLIPQSMDVDLTRIVTGPEIITISGDTDTFNTVNDIKTRLQNVEGFRNVEINSANLDKSGNRVRFKLKIDL